MVEPVTDWSAEPVEVLDLAAQDRPGDAADAWMWADASTPLDVLGGPLYRFALIKVADDRFLFYYRYHHLVMDSFGASLVASRTADIYTGLVTGEDTSDGAFPRCAS